MSGSIGRTSATQRWHRRSPRRRRLRTGRPSGPSAPAWDRPRAPPPGPDFKPVAPMIVAAQIPSQPFAALLVAVILFGLGRVVIQRVAFAEGNPWLVRI